MIKGVFSGELSFIKYIIYLYCLNFIGNLSQLFFISSGVQLPPLEIVDFITLWVLTFWTSIAVIFDIYSQGGSIQSSLFVLVFTLLLEFFAIFPIVYRCINKDPQIIFLYFSLSLHFLSGAQYFFIDFNQYHTTLFSSLLTLTPLFFSSFNLNKKMLENLYIENPFKKFVLLRLLPNVFVLGMLWGIIPLIIGYGEWEITEVVIGAFISLSILTLFSTSFLAYDDDLPKNSNGIKVVIILYLILIAIPVPSILEEFNFNREYYNKKSNNSLSSSSSSSRCPSGKEYYSRSKVYSWYSSQYPSFGIVVTDWGDSWNVSVNSNSGVYKSIPVPKCQ
tara:strand:- start:1559 stop:2560 length:1002 start_codon:yes stop_codon:yes gene_type:complete